MEQLNNLLDKIKETRSIASDNALALALGVKRQTVSNWRKGRALPDAVQCATIAGLTGEPLIRIIGIIGEERAISREEKSVWRRVAASAAALFLVVGAIPLPGHTSDGHQQPDTGLIPRNPAGTEYYVSRLIRAWLRWCVSRLTTRRRRPHAYLLALHS